MQTAAKLVVLLIIVPAAVLIAVYFITEPLIPVVITRQLVSVSVAMCLAGLLVVRTRRPRLGALLVLIGGAVGAAALAAFWNSFFATLACIHGLLIITLFTSQSLSHREIITEPRTFVLRYSISAAILVTGPLTGTAYALSIPLTPDAVAATTLLLLMLYTVILQYYLKEPRLGLFNSALLSLVFATIFAPVLFAPNPVMILVGSSFIFFLGIGFMVTSQSLRIVRNLMAKRPAERRKRDTRLQSHLEPMANKPEETEPDLPETVRAGEWVINPYHAHIASALGVFLTALGIPANFLYRAEVTGWGAEASFDLLFVPLAVLVTLLVLVPSPVFLRLGQGITRHRESLIVHLLGIGVVLAAALSAFEWTQFSLWSLQSSLTASLFLIVAGLTGLFKEVRRLWRRGWMSIVNSFRAMRRWIVTHPIQTGILVDSFLTWMLTSLLYPTFSQQTRSYLGFVTLTATVFSLIALLGLAGLKGLRRRMVLAAIAWSVLLSAAAGFSFWYMVDAMSTSLVDAASVAALWMLGMAAHLALGIRRRASAGPYALGIIGVMYQFWRLDLLAWGVLDIIPPIMVGLFLTVPFLHREYRAALLRLRGAMARAWAAIVKSVRAFRVWMGAHPVQTGVVIDGLVTLMLMNFMYPGLSNQPRPYLGLLALAVSVFSLFALAGVGVLKHHERRMRMAATAWSSFLCAAAAFSLWYMVDAMAVAVVEAALGAAVWMIGMAALLRLGVRRRVPAIPYALGIVGLAYHLWQWDIMIMGTPSTLPVAVAYFLTLPFLHKEYAAAFSRLRNAFVRSWVPFARAVRAAATAAYRALSTVGAAIYRGVVFVGVLLVKFVLLVYAVLVTAGIFYLGYNVFLPAYEFDPVMAVAVSATLFFILYAPAVGYKTRGRPHIVAGFVVGLAASVSVFLFLNLMRTYAAAPEMSFFASTTVGIGIAAVFQSTFPERVRGVFPIALCLSFMSYVSASIFRQVLAVQSAVVAAAVAGIPFAVALFSLGVEVRYRRFAQTGYAIVITPSSLIVCYTMFANVLLLPLTLLLVLAPVAYPLYVRAARALAVVTIRALKALFAFVVAYVVIVFGVISAVITLEASQVLYTFLDAYPHPGLARTVVLSLLFVVIWTPSVLFRRHRYVRLASGLLVLLSLLTAAFAMLWIWPLDAIQTLLIGITVCAFMLTAFSGLIKEIPSWRIPLAVMLFSLLFLGLYISVLEVTLEVLIAAFGTVMIVMMVAGRKVALRLTYPVATATGLGLFFQVVVLPVADPLLAAAMYVGLEALLLCAVKTIYRWPLWAAFCTCAGYVAYSVLLPLTPASIFLACLLGFELLRVTPGENGRLHLIQDTVAMARAVLVGLVTGFFLNGYVSFVLVLATSALFGLLTIVFHAAGKPKTRWTVLTEDAVMATSAVFIAEAVALVLGGYTLASFFAAAVPTAVFLAARVQHGTYACGHYCALSVFVVSMASSFWLLLGYSLPDSIPLMLSSGFTVAVVLYFQRPSSLLTGPRNMPVPITALIALLEIVWIWHAFLVFNLPGSIALVGAGIVLFSTFLYPASSSLSWLKFEYVWDAVSVVNAFSLGSFASAWDLWTGPIPPNPLLTLAWCLSLYSLFSTPLSLVGQKKPGFEQTERTGHMNWAPSLVGWPLLIWSYGYAGLVQPVFLLGLLALAFCGAAGVFILLHPHRTRAMIRWLNIGVASTAAYLLWTSGLIPDELLAYRVGSTVIVWYLLLLPVTLPLTILAGKRVVRFVIDHKGAFALAVPGVTGVVTSCFLIQYDAGTILAFQGRQWFTALGVGMLLAGMGWVLAKSVVDLAKKPGAAFTFLGFLFGMVSVVMPDSLVSIHEAVFLMFACLTASLLLLSGLAIYLHLVPTRHVAHALGGITAGAATFAGLTHYWAMYVLNAVLVSVIVIFVIEAPFLKEQILALIHMLSNLGVLIAAVLRRLGAMLKAIFLRFGYVMWTLFSILVVVGVGYLSFPFFSDLVGLWPGGPLYVVPSYSMPLMLLGLLLITVAAARRKVKTKFGWTGVLTTLAGGGFTGVTWLLDKGLTLLAAAVTMAMVSLLVTAANRARRTDIMTVAVGWTPTPIACGIALVSVLNPPASNLSLQVVVAGLAVLATSVLLVASEKVNLMPRNVTNYFIVIIAITSGVITYVSAGLASMDLLASVYLSVFVVSWLVLPIARRDWIHLFYAPLFFSLTGFAFTFVFGQLSQSLLLAMAAFLLFITLLVRNREKIRPKLVFLRLALLILLVGCIAAFAVISFFSVLTG